jgi:NADH-quinone oxidoreductase subunit J
MTFELVLFFILAAIAVATAVGMVLSKNSVYAALYLVTNFISVAIFYLLLDAPFISLAQVTVYAGAIMVLFLFVIMLLGAEKIAPELNWRDMAIPLVLAAALMVEAGLLFVQRFSQPFTASADGAAFADPMSMSVTLFVDYLLPIQVTGVLLLVAMVGAIVLSKPEKKGQA